MKALLIVIIALVLAWPAGLGAETDQEKITRIYNDCCRSYDPGWCWQIYGPYFYRQPGQQKDLNLAFPDAGRALNQAEDIKRKRMENELLRRRLQEKTD